MIDFSHNQIAERRLEIERQITLLQTELEELGVAERVLARLNGSASPAVDPKKGAPRPKGIPTIFEMVENVLIEAEQDGQDGLFIGEIVDAIRGRYWPGLIGPQITPSIYQFVPARLHKTKSGRFKRLQMKEASED